MLTNYLYHMGNCVVNISANVTSVSSSTNNKQTNNDLLEKDGGTKNCIYKD